MLQCPFTCIDVFKLLIGEEIYYKLMVVPQGGEAYDVQEHARKDKEHKRRPTNEACPNYKWLNDITIKKDKDKSNKHPIGDIGEVKRKWKYFVE